MPICRINTYVIEWIVLRRSCVLVASIERRVSAHFFPSSFPTSFPSGCSPVLNRNNNNHASKWNVRTFSSFRSCLSENSSNKTSNRRAKKAPTTASQTSNRFHPCLDRFFFLRCVFTSSRIRIPHWSIVGRLIGVARLVWRNETGEVKA